MARRLFCRISPLTYRISVCKCRVLRRLKDVLSFRRFSRRKSDILLPAIVYRHNSLIRRTLGNTDLRLQENKAINLSIAAPKVNGILIAPGETFSFWHLVGKTSAARGYREGLTISDARPTAGIGGGLCQFTNLIHWMVLHTPLTVTEHHHHDQFDLFPDHNRQVPFGTGTSIVYNYLDYRFRNDTDRTFQLLTSTTDTHLCGELRADRPLDVKYHIAAENEYFTRENGDVYRNGEIYRSCIDKATGNLLSRELLRVNHAKVLYDCSQLEIRTGV